MRGESEGRQAVNNAENVPETSSSPATSLGRGFELRIVLFPSAQGNPTEAPPVLPDRESLPKQTIPALPIVLSLG